MSELQTDPYKPDLNSKPGPKSKVVEDDSDRRGMKRCCKGFLKFLVSNVGLCILVIIYSLVGGYIFRALEQPNEKQLCFKARTQYETTRNTTKHSLWAVAEGHRNSEDEPYAHIEFRKLLKTFKDNVLALQYDGKVCENLGKEDGEEYDWSLTGATLFAVTIITTIGYGNISPLTYWGRLVCMAYAVMGIPLMLVCLANIGDVLADIFKFVYTKVCCFGYCKKKKDTQDDTKGEEEDEYYDDEEEVEDYVHANVPLTIAMILIVVYLLFGAIVYVQWEEWELMTAFYFCFVTVSTIGFGDLVPGGTTLASTSDSLKMLFTATYMLFGMAILAMCFALIQEEIAIKFRWIGEKLGIVDKRPEFFDDDCSVHENEKVGGTDEKKFDNDAKNVKTATTPSRAGSKLSLKESAQLDDDHDSGPDTESVSDVTSPRRTRSQISVGRE